MKKLLFSFAIASTFLFACNSSGDKETATVTSSETISTEKVELPESSIIEGSKLFTVKPEKTTVKWAGAKKITDGKHNGNVLVKGGEVAVVDGKLVSGIFLVDMNTIHSIDMEGNPKYDKLVSHLKSDDFFDVEKFPTALLEIISVEPLENDINANSTVTGNLTLKGVTESISFPATIAVSDNHVTATAKFFIDRSKWNVRYGSESFFDNLGDGIIKNEIDFEVNFIAEPK